MSDSANTHSTFYQTPTGVVKGVETFCGMNPPVMKLQGSLEPLCGDLGYGADLDTGARTVVGLACSRTSLIPGHALLPRFDHGEKHTTTDCVGGFACERWRDVLSFATQTDYNTSNARIGPGRPPHETSG